MPDPAGAEHRAVFRVPTAGALLDIQLNQESCALLDVNSEGFAVSGPPRFQVGQRVFVVAQLAQRTCSGVAIVRNCAPLAHGRIRYGLQTASGQPELRRALRSIAITAQRRYLSRLAELRRLSAPLSPGR